MALDELRQALGRSPRWTAARKEAVVREIKRGLSTAAEVCREFGLGADELASWVSRFEKLGRAGLSTTKHQRLAR